MQEKSEHENIGNCRNALDKMLKEMLRCTDTELGEEGLNYEGLHDLALFVSNFEQEHNLEKANTNPSDYYFRGKKFKGYAQSDERNEAPGQGHLF